MKKISVLIVDDSPFIRQLFKDMLNAEPDIEVVDTASDPYDAREKIKRLNPQVVTLDIEMPKMDGLSFLEKIMSLRPMPVIMASTLTQKGAAETLRALEIGAVDYVSKPITDGSIDSFAHIQKELAEKVRMAASVNLQRHVHAAPKHRPVIQAAPENTGVSVIAIGSSTGGVEALRHIFSELPAGLPPIVIAQHMPATFTPSFAARLNSLSQVTVNEAAHGQKLERGHAYIAPGGLHLSLKNNNGVLSCKLSDTALVSGHRPSVDVLFTSVAGTVGASSIGVMLTGMGKDGAAGMLKMREAGSYNIGQSKNTCVVYGMPGSAAAAGAIHEEVDLGDIANTILANCIKKKELVFTS